MAEPSLQQDDIEELLRQAQMAAGLVGNPTPAAPPASPPAPAGTDAPPFIEAAIGALAAPPPAVGVAAPPMSFPPRAQQPAPAPPPMSHPVADDVQFLLAQAQQAIASVDRPVEPAMPNIAPFELRDLTGTPPSGDKATLELLKDVDLDVRIELGRTEMYLEDVLMLKRGSVVPLDKLAGDPVDVFVNGRMVARGEVLVMNDNFCVRVTELVAGSEFD